MSDTDSESIAARLEGAARRELALLKKMAEIKETSRWVKEPEELRKRRAERMSGYESCAATMAADSLDYRTDEYMAFGLDRIARIDLQMSDIQHIVEKRHDEAKRERAAVKLGAATSESHGAETERTAGEQRRTAGAVPLGRGVEAGTLATAKLIHSLTPAAGEQRGGAGAVQLRDVQAGALDAVNHTHSLIPTAGEQRGTARAVPLKGEPVHAITLDTAVNHTYSLTPKLDEASLREQKKENRRWKERRRKLERWFMSWLTERDGEQMEGKEMNEPKRRAMRRASSSNISRRHRRYHRRRLCRRHRRHPR